MVRALATTLLAAATLTACASERDLGSTYDENGYQINEQDNFIAEFDEWSNLEVTDASTHGSMGPVADIGGIAAATGYRSEEAGYEYTDVNVVTSNNDGSAMHMLYIEGDLSQLERGQKYTFNGDSYDYDNPTTVYAASTNCSGTGDVGAWDYDVGADEVSITVHDTEQGGTLVEYETISNDSLFGNDVSGGEFVLPAQELDTEEL